jgi:hypothetical protein
MPIVVTPAGVPAGYHRTPDRGLQAYATPHPDALHGSYLPASTDLVVTETRGLWARAQLNGQDVGWVDGRALQPPAVQGSAGTAATKANPAMRVVAAIAGGAIIVGALLDWFKGFSGGASNAFDVPFSYIFDSTTTSQDPKLGIFVLVIGIVAIVCAFLPSVSVLRRVAGAAAVAIAILFVVQTNDLIGESGASLTDVVGIGVWVTGIAGLVVAVLPSGASKRST